MADIEFSGNQVIVRIPKAILILTKAQFIEALRRGKAYQRRKAHQARAMKGFGVDAAGRGGLEEI